MQRYGRPSVHTASIGSFFMHFFLFLKRYELKSILGEGGIGVVYYAYDVLLKRDVAVKVRSLSTLCLYIFFCPPGSLILLWWSLG